MTTNPYFGIRKEFFWRWFAVHYRAYRAQRTPRLKALRRAWRMTA